MFGKKQELFNPGLLMKELGKIHTKLDYLYAHLPCLAPDTDAACPFARHRTSENELMDAGEESHSALTEPVSFHAKWFSYRGPAFAAIALALLGAGCAFGYLLIFKHPMPH